MSRVEVVYLAWNRRAFTEVSFALLRANTDWSLVDRLVVYDDGSRDGTREWLRDACGDVPVHAEFRQRKLRSPVEVMRDYLATSDADIFAKIDNDIAVPPGWLPASLAVLERNPELDLLGLAAGWTGIEAGAPAYQQASHIGGVGLLRRAAFDRYPNLSAAGRYGFTEWQHQNPVVAGWIVPDLAVVQLDLIPEEPWSSLAEYYRSKGWARQWPPYAEESRAWWAWIPSPALEGVP